MVDEGFVTVGSIIGSRIYGCSSESGGDAALCQVDEFLLGAGPGDNGEGAR